jgi:hypothetical protein
MAIDFRFRKAAVASITNSIGCYVLCDLDRVPIYVGQSTEGIRSRVRRHLTSARSDIIANRQIDVWEIAWVLAYPVEQEAEIAPLESILFHEANDRSVLMNGSMPKRIAGTAAAPNPAQVVQVMADDEIAEKRQPALRLTRQSEHYSQIIAHFLSVKNSKEIARAMQAHFERLSKYHSQMLEGVDPNADD